MSTAVIMSVTPEAISKTHEVSKQYEVALEIDGQSVVVQTTEWAPRAPQPFTVIKNTP